MELVLQILLWWMAGFVVFGMGYATFLLGYAVLSWWSER